MEEIHAAGKTRFIDVSMWASTSSSCSACARRHRPAFVQNGWDGEIRAVCRERGIVYSGFLPVDREHRAPALPRLRAHREPHGTDAGTGGLPLRAQLGMQPLTGTTNPAHMREDLGMYDFELAPEDVRLIQNIAAA